MSVSILTAAFCDHGVKILDSCPACNRLYVWQRVCVGLVLAIPTFSAIGLLLVWWLR